MAWLLETERTEIVRAFWTRLTSTDELVAAMLLIPECTSVLRVKAYEGSITQPEALRGVAQMLALPLRISSDQRQFTRAVEMAARTRRRKAYDMQYVAVAELEQAEIVTIDGGVRQAALELGVPVRLLR